MNLTLSIFLICIMLPLTISIPVTSSCKRNVQGNCVDPLDPLNSLCCANASYGRWIYDTFFTDMMKLVSGKNTNSNPTRKIKRDQQTCHCPSLPIPDPNIIGSLGFKDFRPFASYSKAKSEPPFQPKRESESISSQIPPSFHSNGDRPKSYSTSLPSSRNNETESHVYHSGKPEKTTDMPEEQSQPDDEPKEESHVYHSGKAGKPTDMPEQKPPPEDEPKEDSPKPSTSPKQTTSSSQFHSKGTNWHGDWNSGNCGFKMWPRPSNFGYIAMGSSQWNGAAACGECISIKGPGGTFMGIVGDQCPSCVKDGLDLDDSLWKQASGGQQPGIIDISWSVVPCDFESNLKFINKDGTSGYWNSIQVAESNTAIKSLQISHSGQEDWQPLQLKPESNFWQPSNDGGFGETADLKVTCQDGKSFITQGVDIATPQSVHEASSNC